MNFFSYKRKHNFTCFKCCTLVAADEGIATKNSFAGDSFYYAWLCINCGFINVFYKESDLLLPFFTGNKYNQEIVNLDSKLKRIHNQILKAANNQMWETVILLTRIIIMHIAIVKAGAKDDLKFYEYINFLKEKQILNPNLLELLDWGRELSNSLNHKIDDFQSSEERKNKEKAELCLHVIKNVLTNLYEHIHLLKNKKK